MLDAKIEDAICRVLSGLEKYRYMRIPPENRGPRLGSRRYRKWSARKIQRLLDLWAADVPRGDLPGRLGSTMAAVQAQLAKRGLKERDRKQARREVRHAA